MNIFLNSYEYIPLEEENKSPSIFNQINNMIVNGVKLNFTLNYKCNELIVFL